MRKKTIIILAVVVILVMAFWAVAYFLIVSNRGNIIDIGKAQALVQKSFFAKKENCKNLFQWKPEKMLDFNVDTAKNFALCSAVKAKSVEPCNWLAHNEELKKNCEKEYGLWGGFVFPSLETKSCDKDSIDSCVKNGGYSVADCASLCQAIIQKGTKCEIQDNFVKKVCLSLIDGGANKCGDLTDPAQADTCNYLSYTIKGMRNKDAGLADKISALNHRFVLQIYLNNNLSCADLLKDFNNNYCDQSFNDNALQQWTQSFLQNLK